MLFHTLAHRLKKTIGTNSPDSSGSEKTPAAFTSSKDESLKAVDYTPLIHLQQQRQQLEVWVEGERLSYQSIILAIDSKRGLLWIDELFPNLHDLPVGTGLTLRHHRHGEVLTVQSPLVARGQDYQVQGMALLLPDTLAYLPRRQHPRFELRDARIGVTLRPMGETSRHGTLINLSLGGMRLALPGNHLSQLRRDMVLPLCEFTLPNQVNIRCQGVVKAAKLEREPYRHTQVSLAFADMMSDRERLACYLHYLQQYQSLGAHAA